MKKYVLGIAWFCACIYALPKEKFSFAVIGDKTRDEIAGVFSDIIDEVALLSPDFTINIGNLIDCSTDDTIAVKRQWNDVDAQLNQLGCPFYYVPGDCDIRDSISARIYEQKTGAGRYYSFDYGNSHFIIIDNSTTAWATLSQANTAQYIWLVQDLESHSDADHIFVFLNTPAYLNAVQTNTECPLMALFAQHCVQTVFSGALRSYMYLNSDNTEYIVVPSAGAATADNDFARGHFYGYVYVTVDKDDCEIAVIERGNVHFRTVVTGSDIHSIMQAEREVVRFDELQSQTKKGKRMLSCVMTIRNTGMDSIIQPLRWSYDKAQYSIEPSIIPTGIAPDESARYDISVICQDEASVYPLPRFHLLFPFAFGRECTLRNVMPMQRYLTAARIVRSPVIDGVLDDKCWSNTMHTIQLGSYGGEVAVIEPVEMHFCHDKDNLYIGARCFESRPERMRTEAGEHDREVYADDNLWFFFDPNCDETTYYQLIINSAAVVFDRLCHLEQGQPHMDIEWNGPWEVASGNHPDGWTLEVRIPKQGLEPYDKKQWGFNFRRLQTRFDDAGYWSLPFAHDPHTFGILYFE
jgi:hypothetical protein